MPVTRALYYSEAVCPSGTTREAFLDGILAQARINNAAHGITGCLVFSGGYFLQALEGPRKLVTRTLQSILGDDRHTNIGLIDLRVVAERQFKGWSMFSIGRDETIEKIITQQVDAEDGGSRAFDADQATAILRFVALHRAYNALDSASVA